MSKHQDAVEEISRLLLTGSLVTLLAMSETKLLTEMSALQDMLSTQLLPLSLQMLLPIL